MSRPLDSTPASPEQPTLFHGSLDFEFELRNELSVAIEKSGLNRQKIAERMTDLAASRVTVAMLNAWTAPTRTKWQFPLRLAPAFDAATGGGRILALLARKAGRVALTPAESLDAELGAITRQELELQARRAEVLAAIGRARSGR